MTHGGHARDAAEQAALYVAGALPPSEAEAVEAALRAGNGTLADEVRRLQPVVLTLAAALAPLPPPHQIRSRLLATVRTTRGEVPHEHEAPASLQVWRTWSGDSAAGGLFTLRADEGAWEETGVAGIHVRRLFVDRESGRMTAMFRMAPGTSYVPHRHAGIEECYVLQGDLCVGDLVMRAGDYQRAAAGSFHGVQSTEHGCLLLVGSSLTDELV